MCNCSNLAKQVVPILSERGMQIVTMESCTGGRLASYITDVAGASNVLERSYVTYSNQAKIDLGVTEEVIDKYTVYSKEVAFQMAWASASLSNTDKPVVTIGVGITGQLDVDKESNDGSRNIVYYAIQSSDNSIDYVGSIAVCKHNTRTKQKEAVCREVLKVLLEHLS